MDHQRAFTIKSPGLLRVLKTKVGICLPFLGISENRESVKIEEFIAIWDTGATGSVITQKVVEQLNLKPIHVVKVHHAGGESMSPVYLVNIALPNNVIVPNVRVTEGKLTNDGTEVLIGMDIIGLGDFSVTNFGGKTSMSYRMPSSREVDYVVEADYENKKRLLQIRAEQRRQNPKVIKRRKKRKH